MVAQVSQQVGTNVAQQVHTLLHQIFHAVLQAFAVGITHGFETVLIFCVVALVATFFLKDIPLGTRAPREKEDTREVAPPAVIY